uniref:Uncharacterized protein n=1 Tax=Anguilla anguilla TaxID=7936 RepID=A0A0E9X847_ANGAN
MGNRDGFFFLRSLSTRKNVTHHTSRTTRPFHHYRTALKESCSAL